MAEVCTDNNFPYPIPTRYQCIKLLGHGGSGLVYKAYDQRLKRTVAIKFARTPSIISRHRLVNEARLLSSVHHPALCRVFDVGEPEVSSSSLFMVLEYIDGKPLSKQRNSLSVYQTVEVVKSLADGVCRMHETGYAHNDIKSQNIMIRSGANTDSERSSTAVLVDLSIAAPSSPATIQRDIYQLGALLLFLLADIKPDQFLLNPASHETRLPAGLNRIIKKALSTEPHERFQHCHELQGALAGWNHRHQQRKRLVWLGAAGAGVLAIALILSLFLRDHTTRHLMQSGSSEQNQYEHALVFAHYSQHLADNGHTQKAAEQAELALTHFDNAVSGSPTKLKYHAERAHFVLNSDDIFTDAQITTMVLNAINELGAPENYEEKSAAHYLQAEMYLALAKLNSEQQHLVERWTTSALSAAEAAINHQPSVDRYEKLQEEIRRYQSSGGTD